MAGHGGPGSESEHFGGKLLTAIGGADRGCKYALDLGNHTASSNGRPAIKLQTVFQPSLVKRSSCCWPGQWASTPRRPMVFQPSLHCTDGRTLPASACLVEPNTNTPSNGLPAKPPAAATAARPASDSAGSGLAERRRRGGRPCHHPAVAAGRARGAAAAKRRPPIGGHGGLRRSPGLSQPQAFGLARRPSGGNH